MSVCMTDDWKLKTTPVVKLEMPNKTFVPLFVAQITVLGGYNFPSQVKSSSL